MKLASSPGNINSYTVTRHRLLKANPGQFYESAAPALTKTAVDCVHVNFHNIYLQRLGGPNS